MRRGEPLEKFFVPSLFLGFNVRPRLIDGDFRQWDVTGRIGRHRPVDVQAEEEDILHAGLFRHVFDPGNRFFAHPSGTDEYEWHLDSPFSHIPYVLRSLFGRNFKFVRIDDHISVIERDGFPFPFFEDLCRHVTRLFIDFYAEIRLHDPQIL